jgi:hypothetical protein
MKSRSITFGAAAAACVAFGYGVIFALGGALVGAVPESVEAAAAGFTGVIGVALVGFLIGLTAGGAAALAAGAATA